MTQQHIFLSVGFVWHHVEMHLMRLLLGRVSLGFFRLTSHGERDCYLFDVDAVVWCWVAPRGMRSGGSSICTLAANGGRFFLFEYWPGRSRSLQAPLTLRGRGQTWQALAVAVGGAQPVATIVQFQGRCTTSTGHRVSMSRGTFGSDKYLVGDTHVQANM